MSKLTSFLGTSLTVMATLTALGGVLVHLERTSPFPQKPSIVLRVLTGDLPSADLPRLLRDTEAQVEAAKLAKGEALRAAAAHREAAAALTANLRALEVRVAEKQATEWSQPTPPQ